MSLFDPAALLTILGIFVSIIIAYVGHQRKTLIHDISRTELIKESKVSKQSHSVVIDGKPVENLIATKIRFINIGNRTIKPSDFSKTQPFSITSTGRIFYPEGGYKVATKDPESFCTKEVDENTINIEFEYIKPRIPFEIEIWHNGDLSISGELKSSTMKASPADTLDTFFFIAMSISLLLMFLLIPFAGACIYISSSTITGQEAGAVTMFLSLTFLVLSIVIVWVLKREKLISFNLPRHKRR